MIRTLFTLPLTALPLLARAHEGHAAASAPHWHATDSMGLLVMAVAVAMLVQAGRRK